MIVNMQPMILFRSLFRVGSFANPSNQFGWDVNVMLLCYPIVWKIVIRLTNLL